VTARAVRRSRVPDDRPVVRAQVHLAAGRRALWQAPLHRRFAAALADLILFSPVMAFAATVYVRWYMSGLEVPPGLAWYDYLSVWLASYLGRALGFWFTLAAAFTICRFVVTAFAGRTPGMWLLRLDYSTAAHATPGPLRLCLREWVAMVSLAAFGVGWLWALFDDAHRTLADVVSGVYLIPREAGRPVESETGHA
jgi:hypothetical protein